MISLKGKLGSAHHLPAQVISLTPRGMAISTIW